METNGSIDHGTIDASPTEEVLPSELSRERKKCPVFVMGCHRSGTNLLYDTLMSAGGFAVYQGYLPVYKVLIPRFGSLHEASNRKKMMEAWVRSKGFRRSGLSAEQITARIIAECRNGGDFLRIVMDEVAKQQQVERWAVYDPDTVIHVGRIKADLPEALFIHIIRDGRDVAFSLKKMGGFRPFPWNRRQVGLLPTAVYWQWMVRKGREYGRQFPKDYIEVHYEDLVTDPRKTLARLGQFLDQDLDYDRIQRTRIGSLRESNSSFRDEQAPADLRPVNRWKERLTADQVMQLEAVIGECLEEVGYQLTTSEPERELSAAQRLRCEFYDRFLDAKIWLKFQTPMGRLADTSVLELTDVTT